MTEGDPLLGMTDAGGDLDTIATIGGYEDADAVLEEALRDFLRHRPKLGRELAIVKYRDGSISVNRAAELAGVASEEFKAELAGRGIRRQPGFLDAGDREEKLESL